MKKLVFTLVLGLLLTSCGGRKWSCKKRYVSTDIEVKKMEKPKTNTSKKYASKDEYVAP